MYTHTNTQTQKSITYTNHKTPNFKLRSRNASDTNDAENEPTASNVISNIDDAPSVSTTRIVKTDCPTAAGRTNMLVSVTVTFATGTTDVSLLDTSDTVRAPVPPDVPNVNVADATPTVPDTDVGGAGANTGAAGGNKTRMHHATKIKQTNQRTNK